MSSNGLRFTLAAGGATAVTLLALWELKRILDRAASEGGNMTTPPLLGPWQARQAAWRRRWWPVLLLVAIIFGVLSFLAVSLARP